MRPIQWFLLSQNLHILIPLPQLIKDHLKWWTEEQCSSKSDHSQLPPQSHICPPIRLGSITERSCSSRPVVRDTSKQAYQCLGNESGIPCTYVFPNIHGLFCVFSCNRQHGSSCIHRKARWYSLFFPMFTRVGNLDMVSQIPSVAISTLYSGQTQRDCRCAIATSKTIQNGVYIHLCSKPFVIDGIIHMSTYLRHI